MPHHQRLDKFWQDSCLEMNQFEFHVWNFYYTIFILNTYIKVFTSFGKTKKYLLHMFQYKFAVSCLCKMCLIYKSIRDFQQVVTEWGVELTWIDAYKLYSNCRNLKTKNKVAFLKIKSTSQKQTYKWVFIASIC